MRKRLLRVIINPYFWRMVIIGLFSFILWVLIHVTDDFEKTPNKVDDIIHHLSKSTRDFLKSCE